MIILKNKKARINDVRFGLSASAACGTLITGVIYGTIKTILECYKDGKKKEKSIINFTEESK